MPALNSLIWQKCHQIPTILVIFVICHLLVMVTLVALPPPSMPHHITTSPSPLSMMMTTTTNNDHNQVELMTDDDQHQHNQHNNNNGGQGGWKWTQMMCQRCHLGLKWVFFSFFLSLCILILTDVFNRYIKFYNYKIHSSVGDGDEYWPPSPLANDHEHHHQCDQNLGGMGLEVCMCLEPWIFFLLHNEWGLETWCVSSPRYVFFLSFSFFFTHYILDISVCNTNDYQRGSRHVCISSPVCFFYFLFYLCY